MKIKFKEKTDTPTHLFQAGVVYHVDEATGQRLMALGAEEVKDAPKPKDPPPVESASVEPDSAEQYRQRTKRAKRTKTKRA